jgi:hypothetical protein
MEQRNGSADSAEANNVEADSSPPTPRALESVPTPRVLESTPTPRGLETSTSASSQPPKKRQKQAAETPRPGLLDGDGGNNPETPVILSEASVEHPVLLAYKPTDEDDDDEHDFSEADMPKTPVSVVDQQPSPSSPSPSDLSNSSSRAGQRDSIMSPVTPYISEVPPAPPSTPASDLQTIPSSRLEGVSTPLPYTAFQNATHLEQQQQQLAEGAVTPAPTRPTDNRKQPPKPSTLPLSDDFSEWAVGDRYKLLRMLGRGSYGEVAQALDLSQDRADAYVAIKRITSPFDQEVDAVRLFRETHILRRLRGHECVIQLLDVVPPPTDDLDDFHDLYLVFECECVVFK